MEKFETSLEKLKSDIGNFYKPDKHHFIVMNALNMGQKIELQWFFCDYSLPCNITMFFTTAELNTLIPSLREIVASAWVTEAELVDLFNINIENTTKGLMIESDFEGVPLRKKK